MCTRGKCQDDKDDHVLECPSCDGLGCDECKGGRWELKGCPTKFCQPLIPAVRFAELFEKGVMPIEGGLLDQSAKFVEFCQTLTHEEARIKAELDG